MIDDDDPTTDLHREWARIHRYHSAGLTLYVLAMCMGTAIAITLMAELTRCVCILSGDHP